MIQQAFVLTGRERSVRQHIREARVETLWVFEDWNFAWAVSIDRGKIRFDRRPSRAPDMTLTWPDTAEFLAAIQEGRVPDDSKVVEGDPDVQGYVETVYRSFCRSLEQVLKYPVDDAGNPLM